MAHFQIFDAEHRMTVGYRGTQLVQKVLPLSGNLPVHLGYRNRAKFSLHSRSGAQHLLGEADHVHMLPEMNPKAAPSAIANNFKTVTSRLLRKELGNELMQYFKQPVLWSCTYFTATCGAAPLEIIKQYIEQQDGPDRLRRGSQTKARFTITQIGRLRPDVAAQRANYG